MLSKNYNRVNKIVPSSTVSVEARVGGNAWGEREVTHSLSGKARTKADKKRIEVLHKCIKNNVLVGVTDLDAYAAEAKGLCDKYGSRNKYWYKLWAIGDALSESDDPIIANIGIEMLLELLKAASQSCCTIL